MFSWETYEFPETALEHRQEVASVFTLLSSSDNLSADYEQ